MNHSSPVSVSLEVEPELEDVVVELAAEAPLVPVLPLPVDDLEGDVLVGRPGRHPQDAVLALLHRQQLEHGGRTLVDQVGVEDVELVALKHITKFTFRYTRVLPKVLALPISQLKNRDVFVHILWLLCGNKRRAQKTCEM